MPIQCPPLPSVPELQPPQIREGHGGDDASSVGDKVDSTIVKADQLPVGTEPNVALQRVRSSRNRLPVGGQRVLGGTFARTTMGDYFDHLAMVTPKVVLRMK